MPWWVPNRFFELYPDDSIDVAPHTKPPIGVPAIAMQTFIVGECKASDLSDKCGSLSKAFPMDNTTIADAAAKYIRQAYWAAISFTDFNIGRVLDALEEGPHWPHTLIALWVSEPLCVLGGTYAYPLSALAIAVLWPGRPRVSEPLCVRAGT